MEFLFVLSIIQNANAKLHLTFALESDKHASLITVRMNYSKNVLVKAKCRSRFGLQFEKVGKFRLNPYLR